MDENPHLVSVIIATKNEQRNLERLLTSLKTQTFKNFETIVVDNFSTDDTRQIAAKYTPYVFKVGNERSAQRNFGLRHAKGKYVLFLDADMQLEKSILAQCVQKMTKGPKLAGIAIDEVSIGTNLLARIKNIEKEIYRNLPEIEAPRFFKRRDILKIGAYDKNLISGEDWDLAERIKKIGTIGRIDAVIYHHETESLFTDIKKKFYYAKHIAKYTRKNPKAFQKQASLIWRFLILFKKPKIIAKYPREFLGLLILKSAQYLAYLLAKVQ